MTVPENPIGDGMRLEWFSKHPVCKRPCWYFVFIRRFFCCSVYIKHTFCHGLPLEGLDPFLVIPVWRKKFQNNLDLMLGCTLLESRVIWITSDLNHEWFESRVIWITSDLNHEWFESHAWLMRTDMKIK